MVVFAGALCSSRPMALTSTLYRFEIDLSDVDRGVYEHCALRIARHPSETMDFMLTRLLAYLLEYEEDLAFSRGLCVPDEPALLVPGPTGAPRLWIDVGNPAPERIHKASKAAERVVIYTYKDVDLLLRSVAGERIHRAEAIAVVPLPRDLLAALGERVERSNDWTVVRTEDVLYVTAGNDTIEATLTQRPLVSQSE